MRANDVLIDANDEIKRIGDVEYRDVDVTLRPEWVEMIRTGYMCINCFERVPSAWPDECPGPWCRFPIRERQSEFFSRLYQGEDHDEFKPSPPSTQERAKKNGIWVPRSVS